MAIFCVYVEERFVRWSAKIVSLRRCRFMPFRHVILLRFATYYEVSIVRIIADGISVN